MARGVTARQFAFDLRNYNLASRETLDRAFRAIALTVDQRVVLRTAVDTGRARGNWFCSIGEPSTAVLDDRFDATGGRALDEIAATIVDAQLGDVVWLTNNLPYILKLENGWSNQSPQGMVDITLAEVASIL